MKYNVIYVVGAGRSGSTLLEALLGTDGKFFAAGELSNFTNAFNSSYYCSCGLKLNNCDIWKNIYLDWISKFRTDESSFKNFERLDKKFSSFRVMTVLHNIFNSKSIDAMQYADYLFALFDSISKVTGKTYIIDSSKSLPRLMFLTHFNRNNHSIMPVFLLRRPEEVAISLSKSFDKDISRGVQRDIKPKSISRTLLWWFCVNAAIIVWLNAKKIKYNLVYFDDFRQDYEMLEKKLSNIARVKLNLKNHHIHQCAGNRSRFNFHDRGFVYRTEKESGREVSTASKFVGILMCKLLRVFQ